MEVNGQPIFKNQLMRAQEVEEVDKYLMNKNQRNTVGNGGIRRVTGQPGNSGSKPGFGYDEDAKNRQKHMDKNAYGFVAEGGGRKINYDNVHTSVQTNNRQNNPFTAG